MTTVHGPDGSPSTRRPRSLVPALDRPGQPRRSRRPTASPRRCPSSPARASTCRPGRQRRRARLGRAVRPDRAARGADRSVGRPRPPEGPARRPLAAAGRRRPSLGAPSPSRRSLQPAPGSEVTVALGLTAPSGPRARTSSSSTSPARSTARSPRAGVAPRSGPGHGRRRRAGRTRAGGYSRGALISRPRREIAPGRQRGDAHRDELALRRRQGPDRRQELIGSAAVDERAAGRGRAGSARASAGVGPPPPGVARRADAGRARRPGATSPTAIVRARRRGRPPSSCPMSART